MLVLFIIHMAVRAWTLAYFAPTIIGFQSMPPSSGIDPALVQKAARWRNLNLVRVAIFMVVNLVLLLPGQRVARMLADAEARRH
jgi:hypothetical protein